MFAHGSRNNFGASNLVSPRDNPISCKVLSLRFINSRREHSWRCHPLKRCFSRLQRGPLRFFLFMAAPVVSVVIFLCGVLVGRGVRVERGDLTRVAGRESPVDVTPAPPPATTPVPSSRASDPTAAAPPPAVD